MINIRNNLIFANTKILCLSIVIISLLVLSKISIAMPAQSNLVADSDTSTIRRPESYSKPNQSRIWYNSFQNRWDAIIPKDDNNGGSSASDHYIMKDISGSQEFTSVELEDRDFGRSDVFWDDTNRQLYVLSSHPTQSHFWRVGFEIVSDSYTINVGTAGAGVEVPGISHPDTSLGGDSPATLYVSPNGHIWVSVMLDNELLIQYSEDGGITWMNTPINLDNTAKLGVTTWNQFENNGITYIGIFAGENGENNVNTDFSFRYINQNADPRNLLNWTNDSSNIPARFGSEQSDDHISSARDLEDNLYFAVKTEAGNSTDPLINLYRRTPGGSWSQFKISETQETPEQSRPSIVIDNEKREISIYLNGAEIVSSTEREGVKKVADLDSLDNLLNSPLIPIFSQPNTIFSDLITPRHSIDGASGIIVLAHNRFDNTIWFAQEDTLTTDPITIPEVVGLSQANAEQALTNAGFTIGTVAQQSNNTVPAGRVISQNPGNPQNFIDQFNIISYSNNDGSFNWSGNWIEIDDNESGPTLGNVQIINGGLSLDDFPNTGGEPSLEREVNISTFSTAELSFSYRTTGGVDANDSVVLEISDNGGVNWNLIEEFTGITGNSAGTRNLDISNFISNNTRIRFRVNNFYGFTNENFIVDHIIISTSGEIATPGTSINLIISTGQEGSGSNSFLDNFDTSSFRNNDGTLIWANDWFEVDGAGLGPSRGNARIQNGALFLDDRPNTGGQPSLARELDLTGFSTALFSFDFTTTSGVDTNDSIIVEISDNGGVNWVELENFTGIFGSISGTRTFDISGFISNNTQIRFRVNNLYGGRNERFFVDNLLIEVNNSGNIGNSGFVEDQFDFASFANNNGTLFWASSWIETDGLGNGADQGNAQIANGVLSLNDSPNTGGQPSLEREVFLTNFNSAYLSFDFATTPGVDRNDSVILEISINRGENWTILENFTRIFGSISGIRSFNISNFIADNTRIRFRVNNLYGGFNENFLVDNIVIGPDALLVNN